MVLSDCIAFLQNQYITSFTVCMSFTAGGASFVWVTPVIKMLQGPNALIPMTPNGISWMVSIFEVGSLMSLIPCGYICDRYGRRPGIVFGGPFIIAGWLIILFTRSANGLLVARFLQGFGLNTSYIGGPMYLGEIASPQIRGILTSLLSSMYFAGYLFQFVVGSYLSYNASIIVNLIFSTVVYTFLWLVQPESPVFLTMKNKNDEAIKNLMLLRRENSKNDVALEMNEIQMAVENDMKNQLKISEIRKIRKSDLKILLLVQALTFFRIFCGTLTVPIYLNYILDQVNWKIAPELTTISYAIIVLISVFIATTTVDIFGRRPLLIISCIGSTITNIFHAVYFYGQNSINLVSYNWLLIMSLIFFAFFVGIGLNPVTQTVQAELFPTHLRSLGNVLTTLNMVTLAFVNIKSYQLIIDVFGLYANFIIYGLTCITGLFVVYFFVPETKGMSLFEISSYFSGDKDVSTNRETTKM